MGQVKRWDEVDVTQLGLLLVQAFNNLERGEDGEFDLELGGRSLRLVNDSINRRVVIFELSNLVEQRKWHWDESAHVRPAASQEVAEETAEEADENSLR